MTDSGVCIFKPMAVQTHDRLNANTSSSATASQDTDRSAVGPEAERDADAR